MDSAVSPAIANSEGHGPRWRQRAIGVLAAVLAAVLIWVVAVPLAGVDLAATVAEGEPPMEIGVGTVTVAALIISLLGWALLALLEKVTRHGLRIWMIVAVLFTVLSLAGPFAAESGAATAVLALMHLAVGGVLITAMARSVRH
ncbi:DUF6069 family protein [Micromonospora lutea]|uniref:Uncharacterized protein n=1 Tax=Micromonospora lutea TaxID=419825 RepID=A0ABQ4IYB5_9ACTN|nr:DUF6069 family protein [Micromonospora lutea]GIJ22933.1 hypothetical protein Vlu01_35570 [Micromonospora lutea]